MNKIYQYLPLQFGVFLTLGLILGNYFPIHLYLPLLGVFFSLTSSIILLKNTKFIPKIGFQISVYFFFIFLGWWLMLSQLESNQSTHFSHFLKDNSLAKVQIIDFLKPTKYQDKYIVKILNMGENSTSGKSILLVKKDSLANKLALGQQLIVPNEFIEIAKPKNPHTFDYANYMAKRGIYYQNTVEKNWMKPLEIKINSLPLMGLKIRDYVQSKMKNKHFGADQWGIVNAMVLGDRQFISKDLQGEYTSAGVVHILAVSGLHVGILMLILTQLFLPITRMKNGKIITPILIIILLWVFALISGLSGSVVRAVTMFSFITISTFVDGTKLSVLHAVFASYFLLVLIYPLFIFDVGFQLSYLAVIGIVVLQPKMMEFVPKEINKFVYKNLQLLSVSIAATVTTMPLSLYYFHQFPGLFWLSNLVIIPFVGVILGFGLLVSVLASINFLPNFIVLIYNGLLYLLNEFVAWIARQEAFLFKNINLTLMDVIIAYVVIFLLMKWLYSIKNNLIINRNLRLFLVSFMVFQSVYLLEKILNNNQDEIIVFHQTNESIIGYKNKKTMFFYSEKDTLHPENYTFLKSYLTKIQPTKTIANPYINNLLKFDNQLIYRIDSLGIYQNLTFKPKVFLLTQSPKINLERLIKTYQPSLIIADGSNYNNLLIKWENTCRTYDIQFHATKEKGAFIFK